MKKESKEAPNPGEPVPLKATSQVPKDRSQVLLGLCAFAIGCLAFFPVVSAIIGATDRASGDFAGYIPFINHIGEWGMVTRPNFLYPLLVFLIQQLFGFEDLLTLQLWITVSFYGLLAVVLVHDVRLAVLIKKEEPFKVDGLLARDEAASGLTRRLGPVASLALAVAIMLLAPVSFFQIGERLQYYFGYIGIAVYHNANIALCRPLALLHFLLLAAVLMEPSKSTPARRYLDLPALLILTTLAKPNYLMALLPALLLLGCLQVFAGKEFPWRVVALSVFLPGIMVLSWQYAFTFLFPNPDIVPSAIIWAPFAAYELHSDQLLVKWLLSILFPLGVAICYWKELRVNISYQLALLLFAIGMVMNYGLAEDGAKFYDMNFAWTGQIVLFLLMVVSIVEVLRIELSRIAQMRKASPRLLLVSGLFALHLVAGIIWYYSEFAYPEMNM